MGDDEAAIVTEVQPLAPNKTLAIISGKPHYSDGKAFYTFGGFPDYVRGLAAHFAETVLVVPVTRAKSLERLRPMDMPRVRVVPLPGWTNRTVLAALTAPWFGRRIARAVSGCDVVNILMWSMIGFPPIRRLDSRGQPIAMAIVGDAFREHTIRLERTPVRRRLLGPAVRYLRGKLTRALRGHFTFVLGEHLAALYGLSPGRYANTYYTTFSVQDIGRREVAPPRPCEPVRLVSVARFQKGKGMDLLLEALARAAKRNLKFDLTVIGDGPERLALERQRDALGLSATVHFPGYIPHGPEFDEAMSRSHAFVFCSLHEGAPKVVIEALRYGLPVLATRVGAVPTVVEENVNGWLIEAGQVDPIVEALELMSAMEPESWTAMSGRNLELAKRYTIERISREMVQALIDHGLLVPDQP